MTAPKPGIYPHLSYSEYQCIDAVNSGLLNTLRTKTPCHARYEQEHPSEPTPALEFGRLLHLAVLEPKRWHDSTKVLPDDAPRRVSDRERNAKNPSAATIQRCEWWEAWDADERATIAADTRDKIEAMCASIRATQCKQFVTGGRAEVCIVWKDPVTGLLCKGRLDYVQQAGWGDVITDLKTTMDASEPSFRKSVYFYGYFLQAAFYADGWQAVTGETPCFTWLAVEKNPPYLAKAWEADADTLVAGCNAYRTALDTWADCLKTHEFPAYGDDVELLALERWMLEREGVGPHQIIPGPVPVATDDELSFEEKYRLDDEQE